MGTEGVGGGFGGSGLGAEGVGSDFAGSGLGAEGLGSDFAGGGLGDNGLGGTGDEGLTGAATAGDFKDACAGSYEDAYAGNYEDAFTSPVICGCDFPNLTESPYQAGITYEGDKLGGSGYSEGDYATYGGGARGGGGIYCPYTCDCGYQCQAALASQSCEFQVCQQSLSICAILCDSAPPPCFGGFFICGSISAVCLAGGATVVAGGVVAIATSPESEVALGVVILLVGTGGLVEATQGCIPGPPRPS